MAKTFLLASVVLVICAALVVLPERKLSGVAYPLSQNQATPTVEQKKDLSGVPLYQQPNGETCGETAFVMAWNYAHPSQALGLNSVIFQARQNGWYISADPAGVYTSPAHMLEMAGYYAGQNNAPSPSAGQILDEQQALMFLFSAIMLGHPVVVDVTTVIGNSQSGAHFVVVTGVSLVNGEIEYNDPYGYVTPYLHQAEQKREVWSTFWDSWRNNGDDNNRGNGWYMIVY